MDWNSGSIYELTMTANTLFTDSNLPQGTDVADKLVVLDGNFVPTFSTDWVFTPTSEAYSGTVRNQTIVTCVNGNSGSIDIQAQLQNLAT